MGYKHAIEVIQLNQEDIKYAPCIFTSQKTIVGDFIILKRIKET